MEFIFYIKFRSRFGQSVHLEWKTGENAPFEAVECRYLDENFWTVTLSVDKNTRNKKLQYRYFLKEGDSKEYDLWPERLLELKFKPDARVEIFDDWQGVQIGGHVFTSRPFLNVLIRQKARIPKNVCQQPTHIFKVHAPQLPDGMMLGILGSGNVFNNWNSSEPLKLRPGKFNVWSIELDLSREKFPLEYKYVVYDSANGKLFKFEQSDNRKLTLRDHQLSCTVISQVAEFSGYAWKGAGVNVQLSSLRSEKSWGVGDFTDLNRLSAWAQRTGLSMIQLLPINDTTATFTKADSYPYSAVSAFALHPIFLDVAELAKTVQSKLPPAFKKKAKALNQAPSLEYEEVLDLKLQAAKMIFEQQYEDFSLSEALQDFIGRHHYWLLPYAAFCCLRDKYKTADFSRWESFSSYQQEKVIELSASRSDFFREIAFHYFLQFHLDRQLQKAVQFAHKRGIILKGDLPIGVGRYSVDTWMNPELFHMDMQAGAPPDYFTKKGQNWSFPTYNWENMRKDGFSWWRKRLTHMSHYFDAIRIDHILGFFRIWTIPLRAVEGIFGYFVPAIPLSADDFRKAGIDFKEERFCNPLLSEEVLEKYLGKDKGWVKQHLLEGGRFKESFNTQRKIEAYFQSNHLNAELKQKLFDLLADVILLKDDRQEGGYHFRASPEDTLSFQALDKPQQEIVSKLCLDYFFNNQNELWLRSSIDKLDAIQHGSDMMICAEDLGMVPPMVEGVLRSREMLALQVQRMPKVSHEKFSQPAYAPYLSVVTPSTHDMSTIREWWAESVDTTNDFYHTILAHSGAAPGDCVTGVCEEIILQHLESPAMWAVFLIQDLFSIEEDLRYSDPSLERINNPADPHHYWNYRMHVSLEQLLAHDLYNNKLLAMIEKSGRSVH